MVSPAIDWKVSENLLALPKLLKTKRHEPTRWFLRGVLSGKHGRTKREIMRAAKKKLPDIDWEKLKPMLEILIPILLGLI